MSLPMTPVFCLIAIVPVLFLLTAIMKFGWGVARAAPIGMLLAGGIAVLCFKASPLALTLEAGKGIWNAATILLVIWPAVFSYELTCESKGFLAIRRGIQHVTKHELLQILILGWIFPSFLQGITGFGVAVAVGAPLLLSIGVTPFYSIIIVLLCHCWGATFGTLALAWEALIAQAGMNPAQNAQAAVIAAAMIWFYNFLCVVISCWLYGKGKALKEAAPVMILISLIMGGGELLLAPVNATISFFFPAVYSEKWDYGPFRNRSRNRSRDGISSGFFTILSADSYDSNLPFDFSSEPYSEPGQHWFRFSTDGNRLWFCDGSISLFFSFKAVNLCRNIPVFVFTGHLLLL